jgi:antitoxin ParD1/3/4
MQSAEKISITMTPEMMRVIRESVDAGEYTSVSEVFRDAVRAWQRERDEHAERLNAIRARVRRSLDDPRPSLSADEAEAEMARFMEEQAKAAAHAAR